jgi:hypothetical protein
MLMALAIPAVALDASAELAATGMIDMAEALTSDDLRPTLFLGVARREKRKQKLPGMCAT